MNNTIKFAPELDIQVKDINGQTYTVDLERAAELGVLKLKRRQVQSGDYYKDNLGGIVIAISSVNATSHSVKNIFTLYGLGGNPFRAYSNLPMNQEQVDNHLGDKSYTFQRNLTNDLKYVL